MEDQANPAEVSGNGDQPEKQAGNPHPKRWVQCILHVKRKIEERRAKKQAEDPAYRIARGTVLATWVIAGFTIVLAYVSYRQLWEIQDSGAESSCQINQTLKKMQGQIDVATDANRIARSAQRPWVGIGFSVKDWVVGKAPSVVVYFINSGQRPAIEDISLLDSHDYTTFPKSPQYHRNNTDVHGEGLILPNSNLSNTEPFPVLTQERLDALFQRKQTFFVYASIEYRDALTGKNTGHMDASNISRALATKAMDL